MKERIEHPRDYEAESRRHRILWIGGAVVAVLAIIVYFVATRDDGEENRAAYCSALSDMVGSDSLEQALKGANKAEVERITELAPRDVEPAWDSLSRAALDDDPTATESQVDAAKLPAVLDKITEDAAENCDLTLPS